MADDLIMVLAEQVSKLAKAVNDLAIEVEALRSGHPSPSAKDNIESARRRANQVHLATPH